MRQSPRLAPPHYGGNRGPLRGPDTPQHRRAGSALDELIASLNTRHHLGLQVRDSTWSPSKIGPAVEDKVQGQIKRLFFSSRPALDKTLEEFEVKVARLTSPKARVELLHMLLRQQTATRRPTPSRVTTRSQTLREEMNKSLLDKPSGRTPASSQPFHIMRNDKPDNMFTTAPEAESPTDDEADWSPPPSPSASIRSSQGRGQVNTHALLDFKGRKRPSETSDNSGKSPKLTKLSKGKQSSENSRPPTAKSYPKQEQSSLFKKPPLPAAQSFQTVSAQTSFRTSFGANTVFSSQQTSTQPNTALTSFNSDFGDVPSSPPKMTRTSSTTIGSLDEDDLLETSRRLEEEAMRRSDPLTRVSSTTYGSLDDDTLVQASVRYEGTVSSQNAPSEEARPTNIISASPSKTLARPSGTSTAQESPTRISHRIRDIPRQNLFVDGLAETFQQYPYFIHFICLRVALENDIPMHKLISRMDVKLVQTDVEAFWAAIDSHSGVTASHSGRESKKAWLTAAEDFDGYTFKAKVAFNTHSAKPVFHLQLLPLQADKSCRFQRAFGSDRFLYLTFPSFDFMSPRFTNDQMRQIHDQWHLWLDIEHSFLGRKWRAFMAEPTKRGKGGKKDDGSDGYRIVLFATEGLGVSSPCRVGDMMNWFFPFGKNLKQPCCKAFARFDLGLSRTVPTLVFKPSQIRYVNDVLADGTPEDTRFDDPRLYWEQIDDRPVMNDGCSLISLGAAQEIWRIYKNKTGINEKMPTSFQARIGGAKGLWIVSSEASNSGPPPIWISLSKSQLKFQPHDEDFFDESYDRHRTTFELVNHSTSPTPSDLHLSFIPIMVDRGVPKEAIERIMRKTLDMEREQLLELLRDPAGTYNWIHKQSAGTKDLEDMHWHGAIPSLLPDRIKLLLESGFYPTDEPYLGGCLSRFIKQQHLWEEQKLRVPLAKSAFLYGIADPLGILAPGEIHVQFSSRFVDEATGEYFLCLDDMDVLVARQPACRRSDLQKVRVVSHPKLSHLVDVVVFPSKGQYPLAGKLQGGDYDGDIFWTCWEPELVEPFRNAPAPVKALEPDQYGIRQYTEKLQDVIDPHDLSTVPKFLKAAMAFRTGASLLGQVTNYLEKEAYRENRVHSRLIDALCDMHDLLVDAPKQGYTFTGKEFEIAKRKLGLPRDPGLPTYKSAMDECTNANVMGGGQKLRTKSWRFKEENVIDYLYFRVVREHHIETQGKVDELLSKKVNDDPDLQYPYQLEMAKNKLAIKHELNRLKTNFESMFREWNKLLKVGQEGGVDADGYQNAVETCYRMYKALMPEHTNIPEIAAWVEPYLHPTFTKWDVLRASTMYALFPNKGASLIFHMAGKELADLKCFPSRTSRRVVGSIWSMFKPKLTRVTKQFEDTDSEEEEFTTPLAETP